jgi:hypothetical protein
VTAPGFRLRLILNGNNSPRNNPIDRKCDIIKPMKKQSTGRSLHFSRDVETGACVDRRVFSVAELADGSDERQFWLTKTPLERLQAIEQMRRILYGYDPTSERLCRILTVAELE